MITQLQPPAYGAASFLDLSAESAQSAPVNPSQGLGDKLGLSSGAANARYGLGIQSGRLVLNYGNSGAVSVRQDPGSGQASSGADLVAFGSTVGGVDVSSVGLGLKVAEGTNAKQGTAVLVAGTVTVTNTNVTANSRIMLTIQAPGGTPGAVYVSARVAGTSFTITSTSSTDTSTVAYEIFEPG